MLSVTRRYRFSASHRLHAQALTEQENHALYGKCNNPWGHGHNYLLEVTVSGTRNPLTGQVMALSALDRLVHHEVIEKLDHRDLNREIGMPDGAVPTSENLVRDIERRLLAAWPAECAAKLAGLRLRETRRNSFEIER